MQISARVQVKLRHQLQWNISAVVRVSKLVAELEGGPRPPDGGQGGGREDLESAHGVRVFKRGCRLSSQ